MRRSHKFAATAVAGALLATVFGATGATAEDVDVTASLTETSLGGGRVLTAIGGLTLTNLGGETTMSSPLAVSVVETLAQGVTPWSVTAEMITPLTGTADPTATIPNANLSLGACNVTETLGLLGGGSVTASSLSAAADLSQLRTIFTVTGQDTSTVYTNTYTCDSSLDLELPDTFKADAYAGKLQVTLVQ